MNPDSPNHLYPPEEYLALEETAEYRSEYFEGEILAMSGASGEHNFITKGCGRALDDALDGSGCRSFIFDMKVRIEDSNAYYYPDLSVVCGKIEYQDEQHQILTNPVVIIEVLSPSTESFDRRKKFNRYKQISTFREYVLIAQDAPQIDVYFKEDNGTWQPRSYEGLDAVMELKSLGIQIKLADIYRLVEFE